MNMGSYFIRHTSKIAVSEDDINKIFDENKIAIHFPGNGADDSESIEPDDRIYSKPSDNAAIRCFRKLSQEGGYVWAQYYTKPGKVKIGKVNPQKHEVLFSRWVKTSNGPKRGIGDIAKLKALKMENVQELRVSEVMAMCAARPRQGTIREWHCIKERLKYRVEGIQSPIDLDSLIPGQLEAVCAEYLRRGDLKDCPTLEVLLLPVGRTLQDVDIYGYAKGKKRIFAQVTNRPVDERTCKQKIEKLELYQGAANHLVFFCKCPELKKGENGILFVPLSQVFEWLKSNEDYVKAFLEEKN
jgi:hypothetical protein